MSAWKIEAKESLQHGHLSNGWNVRLVVGPQSFCVTPIEYDSREEAEWMAAQLRHAIEAIERGVLAEARAACDALYSDIDDSRYAVGHGGTIDAELSVAEACSDRIRDLIIARLPSCSGCEPGSEGTHSEGTSQHP